MKQILSIISFFIFGTIIAQVNVQLQLSPPFSPYFSDYLAYENKTILIINKPGIQNLDIYFKGKVTGDNGLSLITKTNYKPGSPINLNKPVTILRGAELEPYFTQSNVDVNGANIRSYIVNGGLPEGNYTICLQPFDYTTDLAVGQEICTSFNIKSIEPPILIQPICQANVVANAAQNIVFNWAPGGGSPINTRYVIKMVELLDGQIPNNVLDAITTPPFFEKEVNITTYVYKLSDPKLSIGKTYAWQVTAYDPLGKVFFRNNGSSTPCTFVYQGNTFSTAGTSPRLFITNPDCKGNPNSIVSVSKDTALTLIWNWAVKSKSGKDSVIFDVLKSKNGKDSLAMPLQPIFGKTIQKYKIVFTAKGKVGSNKSSVSENMTWTDEVALGKKFIYSMDLSTCKTKGFKQDHWYNATVTALDANGQNIDMYSCDFRYLEKKYQKKDVIIVRGRIQYMFNDSAKRYGANNIPLKLGIANSKVLSPPVSNPFLKPKTKTVFTDSEGYFYAEVPNNASILEKYLNVAIQNNYYLPLKYNIPLFTKNKSGNSGESDIVIYKDTVQLADIITSVYNVSLTVNVGKGFPAFYVDTTNGKQDISINQYEIDTLTINAKAPIPEGLPIILYRKIKAASIPYYEGQGISVYDFYGEKLIKVAIGKTAKDIQTTTTPLKKSNGVIIPGSSKTISKTVMAVKFDHLLPSFGKGDLYYMRADIKPKTSKKNASNTSNSSGYVQSYSNPKSKNSNGLVQVNPIAGQTVITDFIGLENLAANPEIILSSSGKNTLEDDIEAPIQEVRLDSNAIQFKSNQIAYAKTIDYKLVSNTPPSSRIKGRLMYSWPSDLSKTLYPLKSHTFSVKLAYKVDGNPYVQSERNGLKHLLRFLKDNKGNEIDTRDEGLVVGTGQTDVYGNFVINIVNQNTKGVIATSGSVEETVIDMTPPKTDSKGNPIKNLKDPLINPIDQLGQMNLGDFMSTIELDNHNLTNGSSGLGNSYSQTFGLNAGNIDIKNITGNISNQGMGAIKGNKLNSGTKIIKNGPLELLDENYFSDDKSKVKIERVLVFEISDRHISDPTMNFVCQAFDTKELGVISSEVKEYYHPIKLESKDKTPMSFTNAKAVVFRMGYKPEDIPEGEGTALHPKKALLKTTNTNDPSASQFEWILDEVQSLSTNNQFEFKGKRLLKDGSAAKYYVQISPDIQNSGTSFLPITVPIGENVVKLEKDWSKISGRILDASTKNTTQKGLKDAWVEIKYLPSGKTVIVNVDKDGYFEYKNFGFGFFRLWKDDQSFEITAKAFGYKEEIALSGALSAKGIQFVRSFLLQPAAIVKGRVRNYDKNKSGTFETKDVESFIIRADSSIYSTDATGYFSIPVPSLTQQTITVLPKDIQYFDSTMKFTVFGAAKNLEEIYVKKRLHRMKFQIKDESGNLIKSTNFKITINNDISTVTSNGIADLAFANVSINQFNTLIQDPNNDYIPQITNIKNKESKAPVLYDITMKKGAVLSGNVKLDGANVKNAKVYIDYKASQNNDWFVPPNQFDNMPLLGYNMPSVNGNLQPESAQNASLQNQPSSQSNAIAILETRTNGNGNYLIKGIPPNVTSFRVLTTLDTVFTVIGDQKNITFSGNAATANLNLKRYDKMKIDNIWGFPFQVESIVNDSKSDEVTVTGLVELSQCESPFDLTGVKQKYRVTNVTFKQNKGSVQPNNSSIDLEDVSSIKVRYRNKYNVELNAKIPSSGSPSSPIWPKPATTVLTLTADRGLGKVAGYARIVDNSFNYPSTYLNFQNADEFYLSEITNGNVNHNIPVILALKDKGNPKFNISTYTGTSTKLDYNLCNKNKGAIKFKFLEFKSFADPLKSYIDEKGKIHLNVMMKCSLANAQPPVFDVQLDNLILDNNKIEPVSGTKPINIQLEDWTLQIKNWKVSPEYGGLYAYGNGSSLLKTGFVDVPIDTFNLTSKVFYFGGFKLNQLKLGGGILELSNVSPNTVLVYDKNTGSDNSPHWKMNILANGSAPAARIQNFDGILDGSVDIQNMQLISKAKESIITIKQRNTPYKLYNNNYVKFSPTALSSSNASFSLIGAVKFENIPRLNDCSGILDFVKLDGKLKAELKNFKLKFEAPGYCQFESETTFPVKLSDGLVEIAGYTEEKNQFNAIPSWLRIGQKEEKRARIFFPNNEKNFNDGFLPTNYHLGLDATSNAQSKFMLKLSTDINKNGLWLEGSDWTLTKFSGNIIDKAPGNMIQASNVMDFVVHGEIKANSNQLSCDNIETPFGALSLSYIFPEKKLIGLLHVEKRPFGSWSMEGADLEMEFSPKGWYLLGCGKLNTGTLFAEGLGTFNAGFMLGSYNLTPPMINKLTQFSITGQGCGYLSNNANGFKGFFFTGGYNILDKNIVMDFVLVKGYVKAQLGVEGSIALNLGSQTNQLFYMGLAAAGKVQAGMTAISGTSLCAGVNVEVLGEMRGSSLKSLEVTGKANMTAIGKVKQWVPFFDDIELKATFDAHVDFNIKPLGSPKFGLDWGMGFNDATVDPCKKSQLCN